MCRRRWPLLLALLSVLLPAAPAFAHAERIGSGPEEGARLKTPPSALQIQFSEPPIGDANFEVLDGCDRDLVQAIEVQGRKITATLTAGEPGTWNVRTEVVSGIDGHATKDRWRFKVSGAADCESPPPDAAGGGGKGNDRESGSGGSFPLLAFAVGTLAVIAVALALRGRTPGN